MRFYALIVGSVPPSAEIIASGDEYDFARDRLSEWVAKHPLGEFEEGLVVKVEPDGDPGLVPTLTLGIKFASLAVHVEEMIETGILVPDGPATFDLQAIEAALSDPDIKGYIERLRPLALLPEKR